eukprot:1464539-Rhodomonas_salina.1
MTCGVEGSDGENRRDHVAGGYGGAGTRCGCASTTTRARPTTRRPPLLVSAHVAVESGPTRTRDLHGAKPECGKEQASLRADAWMCP